MTDVTVQTPDGPMEVYVARPDGDVRGGAIVIQEAFGVTEHIQDVAGRLAAAGYVAAAPHLFHRSGDPVIEYSDFFSTMPHMQALTHAGMSADVDATLALLGSEALEPGRVGIVGFCLGGSTALMAGAEHDLGAAVTFYGGGHGGIRNGTLGLPPLLTLAPTLRSPWLGLFGDEDGGLPPEEVEALREAAAQASVDTEVVRYAGAGHGFNRDVGDAYDPEAAQDAWGRTLAWFDAHLAH